MPPWNYPHSKLSMVFLFCPMSIMPIMPCLSPSVLGAEPLHSVHLHVLVSVAVFTMISSLVGPLLSQVIPLGR